MPEVPQEREVTQQEWISEYVWLVGVVELGAGNGDLGWVTVSRGWAL